MLYSKFIKFFDKKKFNYEFNFFNRISIINAALNKFDLANCKYLEIGVDNNFVFNSIPLKVKNKIGVDPIRGGTHRVTSDQFFKSNKCFFDLIFIDGDHHYHQARKDFVNSLKFLKPGGIIILHDTLPNTYYMQSIPQKVDIWTGDVWKLLVEIFDSSKKKLTIANIDYGVTIIKPLKNFKLEKKNNYSKLVYDDFLKKYFSKLPIKNSEDCLDDIANF